MDQPEKGEGEHAQRRPGQGECGIEPDGLAQDRHPGLVLAPVAVAERGGAEARGNRHAGFRQQHDVILDFARPAVPQQDDALGMRGDIGLAESYRDGDWSSPDLVALLDRRDGFDVVAQAGTVAEAVAEAARFAPDLVIMDVRLPDGSGMDLFADENLRGDAEIVLITGNASVETSVQALRLKMKQIIQPFLN